MAMGFEPLDRLAAGGALGVAVELHGTKRGLGIKKAPGGA